MGTRLQRPGERKEARRSKQVSADFIERQMLDLCRRQFDCKRNTFQTLTNLNHTWRILFV